MSFIPIALFFLNQILRQLLRSRKFSHKMRSEPKINKVESLCLKFGQRTCALASPSPTQRLVDAKSFRMCKSFFIKFPLLQTGQIGRCNKNNKFNPPSIDKQFAKLAIAANERVGPGKNSKISHHVLVLSVERIRLKLQARERKEKRRRGSVKGNDHARLRCTHSMKTLGPSQYWIPSALLSTIQNK
jgi:hypothetical protein